MKKRSGIILLIIAIVIAWVVLYLVLGTKEYYTRVDNRRYEDAATSDGYGMKCKYTLKAFDEKGNNMNVSFKTSKILKEGAYLELTYTPIRGVTKWIEVNYSELPKSVQENYAYE